MDARRWNFSFLWPVRAQHACSSIASVHGMACRGFLSKTRRISRMNDNEAPGAPDEAAAEQHYLLRAEALLREAGLRAAIGRDPGARGGTVNPRRAPLHTATAGRGVASRF